MQVEIDVRNPHQVESNGNFFSFGAFLRSGLNMGASEGRFLTPSSLFPERQQVACVHQLTQTWVSGSSPDVATIDLRGANYSDWQLCLNEEEAGGTSRGDQMGGPRWRSGRNGSNQRGATQLISFSLSVGLIGSLRPVDLLTKKL